MNKIIVSIFVVMSIVANVTFASQSDKRPTKRLCLEAAKDNSHVVMNELWKHTPPDILKDFAEQSFEIDSHSGFICVNKEYLEFAYNFANSLMQEQLHRNNQLREEQKLHVKYQVNMALENLVEVKQLLKKEHRVSAALRTLFGKKEDPTADWINKVKQNQIKQA